MDALRAPFTVLRTLAVAGAMAAPALAAPATSQDSVTRTFVDADGTVIQRHGNSERLGKLVDQAQLGSGQDDARVINKEHGYAVMAGKDHPHDQLAAEHGEEYARTHVGQHTLAVVGETDAQGHQGFIILDGSYGAKNSASAEEWLRGHGQSKR